MNLQLAALFLLASAAQAPSPSTLPAPAPNANAAAAGPDDLAPVEPARIVEAYDGSLAEGLSEIERHARAGEVEPALAVAEALLAPNAFLRWRARVRAEGGWKAKAIGVAGPALDLLGLEALPPAHRAAVEYARGVVLAGAERRDEAERAFESARAEAGPGPLRLDAVYNLGTSALEAGEAERAKIPEIQERAGGAPATTPPAGAPPTVPGAQAPGEPGDDPLANARAAYLRAREHFVERVRADWRDLDTRANLELVQRRLRELDEIEKQREEQKQQEQQDPQDPQDGKNEQDPKDQKDEQKPEDGEKPPEPSDQKGEEPPKPEDQEKPPEEPEPDEKEQQEKEAQPPEPAERKPLSKEQMMQLLDRLKELEEQARKLQEQMQRARRVKVKKDW